MNKTITNHKDLLNTRLYFHTLGQQVIAEHDSDITIYVDEVKIRGRCWAATTESIQAYKCSLSMKGEEILTCLVVHNSGLDFKVMASLIKDIHDSRNDYQYQTNRINQLRRDIFSFASRHIDTEASLTENMFMRGFRIGQRAGAQAYHDAIQNASKEALKNSQSRR